MTTAGAASPADAYGRNLFAALEQRAEGRLKVTGQARYTADFRPPGMLYARYLLSRHPHARIVSIDAAAARAVPGVHAVLTGADIGPMRMGRVLMDWPVLAFEKVRFVGERVAAVAAESVEAADEAVKRIEVAYDPLPAVLDPEAATAANAPIVHEDAAAYVFLAGTRAPVPHPNIQGTLTVNKGEPDIEQAFARADRVFEHVFRTPREHTGYIEPHGALVWIDDADKVHVVCTNKSPFLLRRQMALAIGLPAERIVVETNYIGGDFGGKGLSLDEPVAYALARATGRPVRSVMPYVEDMQSSTTRHAASIRLRTGVDRDGRFVAHESHVLFDGGAYDGGKAVPSLVLPGGFGTLGPYHVPNTSLTLTAVYTNAIPAGHVRAPGEPQAQFAGESHVDMMARELGIDPLEFRLRNVLRPGYVGLAGERFSDVRGLEVLETIRRETGWGPGRPPGSNRGRGLAFAMRGVYHAPATVRYRLETDGTVTVLTGVPEQGSGMHTMLRRVAAATLSVEPSRVRVLRGTTDEAPFDLGASGSWVTTAQGQAAARGAALLKERMQALTAEAMGWPEGQVVLEADQFRVATTGDTVPFATVAARIARGGEVAVDGTYEPPPAGSSGEANCSAYAAEVEVDPETGAVDVQRLVLALDVGTIINPIAHQGQLNGSLLFGLGAAMMEELVVDEGKVVNPSPADYKVPVSTDMPQFKTVLVPAPTGPGPFGAKAAGEVTNGAVPAAIANAVADAVGARLTALPLSPERVLACLTDRPPQL